MGRKVNELRAEAVRRAIADLREQWKKDHGERLTQTQMAEWFGVTQGKMSEFDKTGVVGQKLADGVADHLGTTVDGLIKLYTEEWRDVRVGNIPGWKEAAERARQEAGELGESLEWAAAAEVVLPIAPRHATASFAYDLAHLLTKHVRSSGTVRARRAASR